MTGPSDLEFRRAVSWFLTGIAVMTSVDENGQPHGMTANAVSSLSLDPLLVLVCVARDTHMAATVQEGRVFALSFLADDQQGLSEHFASPDRGYGLEEFAEIPAHAGVTGSPLLDGAAAWIDCELHDVLPGGDHHIMVGRVVSATESDVAGTLIYTPDGYGTWARGDA